MNPRKSKIGLGTVQWGMTYGVANRDGQTPPDEVGRILAKSKHSGITLIDTAASYGDAEVVLGQHDMREFRIVTKTPRFSSDRIAVAQTASLTQAFQTSLLKLRVPSLYGLLIHNADDILLPGGDLLVQALVNLRASGLVARIGVSVYNGMQISGVLKLFVPDLVQLPLNVFDQRLIDDGSIGRLKSLGVEVHARSAFLQGLLLMPLEVMPERFRPWESLLRAWHSACAEQGVLPRDAALGFVCDVPDVDFCVVGVQNCAQLDLLLGGLDTAAVFDARGLACNDEALINPANWSH